MWRRGLWSCVWFRLGRLFSLGLRVLTCETHGILDDPFYSTPASGSVKAGILQHSCATSLEVCVRHLVVGTDSAVNWLGETEDPGTQAAFIYIRKNLSRDRGTYSW